MFVAFDFVAEREQPPQHSPEEQHAGDRQARHRAVEQSRADQAGQRDQQRAEEFTVQQDRVDGGTAKTPGESKAGEQLQRVADPARQRALLAQPEPDQRGALDGPRAGGRLGRQGQRHGNRGEADRQQRMRFAEQLQAEAAQLRSGEERVDRRRADRAECERHAFAFEQADLQRESDERRTEDQRAVDKLVPVRRLAACGRLPHPTARSASGPPLPLRGRGHRWAACGHRLGQGSRMKHGQGQVEREEQQQERLGAGEEFRPVLQHAPHGADAEREGEADQVQHAPWPDPGDREHGGIEHGVVAEQGDMIAVTGRDQDRGEEAADDGQHRERDGVLEHGQQRRAGDDDDQQCERQSGRQHCVQTKGGEHGQDQHADRAALQAQGEIAVRFALAPGEHQRGERCRGDAGEAKFHRHAEPALIGGVFQQRGDTEEQHDHADLDRHVALGEPALDRGGEPVDRSRLRGAFARRSDRFHGCGRCNGRLRWCGSRRRARDRRFGGTGRNLDTRCRLRHDGLRSRRRRSRRRRCRHHARCGHSGFAGSCKRLLDPAHARAQRAQLGEQHADQQAEQRPGPAIVLVEDGSAEPGAEQRPDQHEHEDHRRLPRPRWRV